MILDLEVTIALVYPEIVEKLTAYAFPHSALINFIIFETPIGIGAVLSALVARIYEKGQEREEAKISLWTIFIAIFTSTSITFALMLAMR